ncbi:hypothetical protein ACFY7C_34050 [Streptomyces sp. NPDC012769]|uniref:hypothetical protein n=1 Tax=Streptomyces sp. NPDC012769 TaxID=3364848 RepID=UPI0036987CE0
MDEEAREDARRWLAEEGVTRVGEDEWTDGEHPGQRITTADVAVRWADQVFVDERLDPAGQLRLAFGLLDLLDVYWVTAEIGFPLADPEVGLSAEAHWDGYRQRLEAPEAGEALTYSLWVDWFEDARTSASAFAEVLGRDVDRLRADAPEPLLRRAGRVLEVSGPVPWPVKEPALRAAAGVPALHREVFRGLLNGYHSVYGDLEPSAALALLAALDLPPDTEHLTPLRRVLTAGHANHYRSRDAWAAATSHGSDRHGIP